MQDDLLSREAWLRRVAHGVVKEEHLAGDVVQELWLQILEKEPTEVRHPGGWLRRVVFNLAYDRVRSETRRGRVERARARDEEVPAREIQDDMDDERAQVARVLTRLSDEHREVVRLHYFEEMPLKDIAEQLGIKEVTARARHRRALLALRRELGLPAERPKVVASVAGVVGAVFGFVRRRVLMVSSLTVGVLLLVTLGRFLVAPEQPSTLPTQTASGPVALSPMGDDATGPEPSSLPLPNEDSDQSGGGEAQVLSPTVRGTLTVRGPLGAILGPLQLTLTAVRLGPDCALELVSRPEPGPRERLLTPIETSVESGKPFVLDVPASGAWRITVRVQGVHGSTELTALSDLPCAHDVAVLPGLRVRSEGEPITEAFLMDDGGPAAAVPLQRIEAGWELREPLFPRTRVLLVRPGERAHWSLLAESALVSVRWPALVERQVEITDAAERPALGALVSVVLRDARDVLWRIDDVTTGTQRFPLRIPADASGERPAQVTVTVDGVRRLAFDGVDDGDFPESGARWRIPDPLTLRVRLLGDVTPLSGGVFLLFHNGSLWARGPIGPEGTVIAERIVSDGRIAESTSLLDVERLEAVALGASGARARFDERPLLEWRRGLDLVLPPAFPVAARALRTDTGQPVRDVRLALLPLLAGRPSVVFEPRYWPPSADGREDLGTVAGEGWVLIARAPGFEQSVQLVEPRGPSVIEVSMTAKADGSATSLVLQCVDPALRPVPGAELVLIDTTMTRGYRQTTDGQGRLRCPAAEDPRGYWVVSRTAGRSVSVALPRFVAPSPDPVVIPLVESVSLPLIAESSVLLRDAVFLVGPPFLVPSDRWRTLPLQGPTPALSVPLEAHTLAVWRPGLVTELLPIDPTPDPIPLSVPAREGSFVQVTIEGFDGLGRGLPLAVAPLALEPEALFPLHQGALQEHWTKFGTTVVLTDEVTLIGPLTPGRYTLALTTEEGVERREIRVSGSVRVVF